MTPTYHHRPLAATTHHPPPTNPPSSTNSLTPTCHHLCALFITEKGNIAQLPPFFFNNT
jgi:hypothetical protein